MKFTRLMVSSLSVLAFVGLGHTHAQDVPKALEQNLDVPAEPPASPPAAGARETGYMGLTVDLMAPEGKSVYIVSVVEGGPAAKSGLMANDVVMEINRQKIGNLQDLGRVVRQPPGTKLEFKVRRNNVPQRFAVTLGTRSRAPATGAEPTIAELPPPALPQATSPAAEAMTPAPRTDGGPPVLQGSRPNLGITVADAEQLSDADKRRFGVVVDTGAVISGIREGAPAARAGLPIGGVVVSVNGKRIGSAQDIVDLVLTFQPGEQIEVTYWEGDRMGRKKVRVGRSAVAAVPAAPGDRATTPAQPRARPRRRGPDRPILNALERILDDVLPPASDSRPAVDAVPPPLPPRPDATVELPGPEIEPPAAELPEPRGDARQLEALRKQAAEMQQQLEVLLRRIEELENNKRAPGK